VFPVKYELSTYILFGRKSVLKDSSGNAVTADHVMNDFPGVKPNIIRMIKSRRNGGD
jgi:hypothetical protein